MLGVMLLCPRGGGWSGGARLGVGLLGEMEGRLGGKGRSLMSLVGSLWVEG